MLASEKPNAKRRDAIAALDYVGKTAEQAAGRPSFDFEPEFWRKNWWGPRPGHPAGSGLRPLAASILDIARRVAGAYRGLSDRALSKFLAGTEAGRAGIRVARQSNAPQHDPANPPRYGLALRRAPGVARRERPHRRGIHRNLPTRRGLRPALASRPGRTLDEAITVELKRRGSYAGHSRAVGEQTRALTAVGTANPSLEDAGVDMQGLMAWYKERFRPLHGLEVHAKGRGFGDVPAFLREVVKAYCAEKKAQPRASSE